MKTNRIKQLRFFILTLIAILAPKVMWAQTCSHEFNETTDPHHTVCTKCSHSFLRYTTQNDVVVSFHSASNEWNWKDAKGNNMKHLTNTNTNGEGIIEFEKPIVDIPGDKFMNVQELTSLIVPVSVTSIGNNSFNGCDSLSSIILPNSVTSIGHYAFPNCI